LREFTFAREIMKRTAILFVVLLGGSLGAGATTLVRLDLDDLAGESSAVVYGRIVASRVEWNQARTLIYTVYTVAPVEYLKGRLGPTFELREPGGTLDGIQLSVGGVPTFSVGQEAVLFVWTDRQGQHQVTGFEQGVFPVRTDPQTGLKVVDRVVRQGSARTASAAASPSSRILLRFFDQIRSSAAKLRRPEANQ
jgi:hypothetical protein